MEGKKCNIMLVLKTYYIAGHGSGHKMEGVLSPVYIHALWLDCGLYIQPTPQSPGIRFSG